MTVKHRIGVYWAPGHQRRDDLVYMEKLQPDWIRILDPDVFDIHQALSAVPDANILLRFWWLDDGNRQQHVAMENDPEATGRRHAAEWAREIERLTQQATARGLCFPARKQLYVSGVNEPDTYRVGSQIRDYTGTFLEACEGYGLHAAAFCFSVGHPAKPGEGPWGWAYFAQLESTICSGDHVIDLHEYHQPEGPNHVWTDEQGRSREDWGNLAGRHHTCPIGAPIVIGEWGIDGHLYNRHPQHVGWQSFVTAEAYADQLVCCHNHATDNVVAILPFLTDYRSNEWHSFDTEPAHDAIIARLGQLELSNGDTGTKPNTDFDRAFAFVVDVEGGYSTDPNDPGNWTPDGRLKGTKYGISARQYPHLDIEHLTLDQAKAIYQRDYWQPSEANRVPWPFSLVVFDSAVQHGPEQAKTWLGEADNLLAYLSRRQRHYTRIRNSLWSHFGKAWMKRMARLMQEAA